MAATGRRKTIIVTGDLIIDHNLVQHPDAPPYHHEPMRKTVLCREAGGAWYLQSLIEHLLAESGETTHITGPKQDERTLAQKDSHVSKAYMIWKPFEKVKDHQEKVWRIDSFLGCQRPKEGAVPVPIIGDTVSPDLLVIDDICLGFRDDEALWPLSVKKGRGPRNILVKTSLPPGGVLWKHLLARYADRLTVVLTVEALRSRGADITRALSWDKAINQTVDEISNGFSQEDLALCRRVIIHYGCAGGAASFSRLRPHFDRSTGLKKSARFETFVYHPVNLEGSVKAKMPGMTFGASSIMTAAVARHIIQPDGYPLFIALGRSLAAMSHIHESGGGDFKGPDECFSTEKAHLEANKVLNHTVGKNEPAAEFRAAFPHEILSDNRLRKQRPDDSNLLQDLTGAGSEYILAKATDVVLRGPVKALGSAPMARYGKYITVDRDEIERINALRNLILAYKHNSDDRRPLSIAVFGPPGTGKSFAIKQLGHEVLDGAKPLEFNLSQFHDVSELHEAFHLVRDESLRQEIPLVFWDEFDTSFGKPLAWLKEFLAPMQDSEFIANGVPHPFAKAIFVFAGGTKDSLDAFDRSDSRGKAGDDFRNAKGPDFVSRLRGYLNVKGPNPVSGKPGGANGSGAASHDTGYMIRRAIILRSALESAFLRLIDADTQMAAVSTSIIKGFLLAEKFRYGARSIEQLVKMSTLEDSRMFEVSHLAPRELLKLHVTSDFEKHVASGELEAPVVEILAEACHSAWSIERKKDEWTYGHERDDEKKKHPLLLPYDDLKEEDKEYSRVTARLTSAKLHEIGYEIVRRKPGAAAGGAMKKFTAAEKRKMMKIEHDIWMRGRLSSGFAWAKNSNDELFLNRCIAPFDKCFISDKDKDLDRAIVESIPAALWDNGYQLRKTKSIERSK